MQPHKKRLVRLRIQPVDRVIDRDVGRARRGFRAAADLRHLVIINSKALVEPEHLLQDCGADVRRRVPTMPLQDGCHGDRGRLQRKTTVVPDLVHVRICAGEHAGVGGLGEGRLRYRFFEQNALLRDGINIRGLDFLIPITVQMVRPHGVQGDEHHVDRLERDLRIVAVAGRSASCNCQYRESTEADNGCSSGVQSHGERSFCSSNPDNPCSWLLLCTVFREGYSMPLSKHRS